MYIKLAPQGHLGHDHIIAGCLESGWLKPGRGGMLVFALRTFVADTPEALRHVGIVQPIKPADQKKMSQSVLGPGGLDVQKHPLATLKITHFDPAEEQLAGSPGLYLMGGTLTLHGQSRPILLAVRLAATTDPTVRRLEGQVTIRQTNFGITPHSSLAGLIRTQDRMEIRGELVLHPSIDLAAVPPPALRTGPR